MIFLKRRALMTRFSFNYKAASGVGSLVLEKCAETFFKQFKLLGNSVQETTTGKNLFDKDSVKLNFEFTYAPSDVEGEKEGWFVSDFIPVLAGKTYFISGKTTGFGCKMYDKDKRFVKNIQAANGAVLIEDNISYFRINGEIKDLKNIQIELGTKATPYEPYTGSKPSPSPEFPQEIKNVGKYNELTGKYEIDVQVTGKNLLPKEIVLINNNNNDAETITYDEENHQYILQMKENNTNQVVFMFYLHLKKGIYTIRRNIIVDGVLTNKKDIVVKNANTNVSLVNKYNNYYSTFEVPEDMKVLINAGDYTGKKNKDAIIYDFQLEMGDKVTDYEPYREPQTVTLSLNQQLRGIGKCKDEVTKNGVVRRVYEQNIKKEQVSMNEYNWITKIFRCYITNEKKLDSSENYILMSNISKKFNIYRGNNVIYWGISEEDIKSIGVTETDSREMAFEKIKTFVNNNNIVVQYPLEEPIIEPLSEENKLALESLHTNEGITVIAVDGGEVEAGIEVEYAVKE